MTPRTLTAVRQYLDHRLTIDRYQDVSGNGLLHAGDLEVQRIGAALNTSFHAIRVCIQRDVNLLLVHHAPWAEIDLELRARKLELLAQHGISLYAAHEALDRLHGASTANSLARTLQVTDVCEGKDDLTFGAAPNVTFEHWMEQIAVALNTRIRAWRNNQKFERIAIVPGGGGTTLFLSEAARLGCDTFITGEGSLYTELFAREIGISLVYASHNATEFPAVCDFARSVAADLELDLVEISEEDWITGGGPAPFEISYPTHSR